MAFGAGLRKRHLAPPYEHVHSELPAIAGNHLADAPIAMDAQRLSPQRIANPDLPFPCLEGGYLPGDLPHGRKHQPPGQLRHGVEGVSECMFEDTAAPRRVQAGISMWG
jgi:hypothetical protein